MKFFLFAICVVFISAPAIAAQDLPPASVESTKIERTIGVCQLIENPAIPLETAFNGISPAASAWIYLRKEAKLTKQVTDETLVNAKTSLLKVASHGTLKYLGETQGEALYQYYPDSGYVGADQATFLVEMGGYKIEMVYHFKVGGEFGATDGYDSYDDKKNCPNGRVWNISSTYILSSVGVL
ncbi:MAG TPA: hypothetical protein VIJ25_16915 [Methylococcales bacterium]